MKNVIAWLLALTTASLAAYSIVLFKKNAAEQRQVAELRVEAQKKSQQLELLEMERKQSEDQKKQLVHLTEELGTALKAQQEAAMATTKVAKAGAPASLQTPEGSEMGKDAKGGLGKMISKMMEDPEMKKFIREQQRGMMNQLYSPLIKQLGLTPEEGDKFKELLADNVMKATEKATSLFGGGSSSNRTEVASAMADEQKNFDEQVKTFLGDARYEQYKEYQQTVGERSQLTTYRQQNPEGANALTDQQTEQLLVMMKEEKQKAMSELGLPTSGSAQDQANMQAMLSKGEGDKLVQAQEAANQRVYDRATGVLAAEQLQSFAKFQTNQVQMLRMGMNMARQMFSSEKEGE